MTSEEFATIIFNSGLKQREVASRLDVGLKTVYNWKNGKTRIDARTSVAINELIKKRSENGLF